MRRHNALARRLRDRQDDYLGYPGLGIPPDKQRFGTGYRMIKLCRRSLAVCAPWPGQAVRAIRS